VLEIFSVLTISGAQDISDDKLSVGEDASNFKTSTAGALYESMPSQMGPKTITIYSQKLANALRAVVQYYPSVSLIDRSIGITEPYMVLYHHFAELEAYRDSHPSQHSEVYRQESTIYYSGFLALRNPRLQKRKRGTKEVRQFAPSISYGYSSSREKLAIADLKQAKYLRPS